MKLYANGCSFTWGGDIIKTLHDHDGSLLDDSAPTQTNNYRLSVVWPKHLGDLLKCTEVHNHSLGCGSNNRIVRRTLDFFLPKVQNSENMSDWVAVIQWSDPSRFEFYNADENCWTTVKHDMSIDEKYRNPNLVYETDPIDQQLIYSYYRKFNNKVWTQKWFEEMLTLGFFFKQHNIKYLFTSMLPTTIFFNESQLSYLKDNFNWCYNSRNNHILWSIPDLKIEQTSHPTLLGHKQIAERFHDQLTGKGIYF